MNMFNVYHLLTLVTRVTTTTKKSQVQEVSDKIDITVISNEMIVKSRFYSVQTHFLIAT